MTKVREMTLALIVRDLEVCEVIQKTLMATIDAYQRDNPGASYLVAAMVVGTELIVQGSITIRCVEGRMQDPQEARDEAMKVINDHFGYKSEQN